jgi:hypothetical protein
MALINYKAPSQPFISFRGVIQDFGAVTSAFFQLATVVTDSSQITKTSATRLTFTVAGIYEFDFQAYGAKVSSIPGSFSHQYGINGVFTAFTTFTGGGNIWTGMGLHSIIFQVNAGDYFEMRQVLTAGTISQNITGLGRGLNSNCITRICDAID